SWLAVGRPGRLELAAQVPALALVPWTPLRWPNGLRADMKRAQQACEFSLAEFARRAGVVDPAPFAPRGGLHRQPSLDQIGAADTIVAGGGKDGANIAERHNARVFVLAAGAKLKRSLARDLSIGDARLRIDTKRVGDGE